MMVGANKVRSSRFSVPHVRKPRAAAVALFELLIILLIIALVSPVLLLSLARYRAKGTPKNWCANNLKNISIASQIFAADHNGLFPWQTAALKLSTNVAQVFLSITNELNIPRIFICPADARQPATNWANFSAANISYFIGRDSSSNNPTSIMAGDRNVTINSQRANSGPVTIARSATVAWDSTQHHYAGYVIMGDGSVQIENSARFNEAFHRMNIGTNGATFLFP